MAGHNRWSSIRHKKSIQDVKRGKLFTKLMREIMVAARLGGGDPDANPRLKNAIAAAKAANKSSSSLEIVNIMICVGDSPFSVRTASIPVPSGM